MSFILWVQAHPWLALAILAIVSALANWATYPADPLEWERIKVEEPRRAGAILVLRGFGIYPAKILRGLLLIFTAPPAPPAKPETPSKPVPPSPFVAKLAAACLSLTGCAWFSGRHVRDVASIVTCVADMHDAGAPPGEIALTCGLENADRVLDLIKAQKAIAAKRAAK